MNKNKTKQNKKGFFFLVEFIVLLAVAMLVIFGLPKVTDNWISSKSHLDLKFIGFENLFALDHAGILSKYINSTDFSNSNFSALSIYINQAFLNYQYRIEYWNGTNCFWENGTIKECGLGTFLGTRVDYTVATLQKPIQIRLYIRGRF
ncbi:MAG: hypothetical protein ACP5IJ_00695 [Candidatus Nanoarchaeia archaeon]